MAVVATLLSMSARRSKGSPERRPRGRSTRATSTSGRRDCATARCPPPRRRRRGARRFPRRRRRCRCRRSGERPAARGPAAGCWPRTPAPPPMSVPARSASGVPGQRVASWLLVGGRLPDRRPAGKAEDAGFVVRAAVLEAAFDVIAGRRRAPRARCWRNRRRRTRRPDRRRAGASAHPPARVRCTRAGRPARAGMHGAGRGSGPPANGAAPGTKAPRRPGPAVKTRGA